MKKFIVIVEILLVLMWVSLAAFIIVKEKMSVSNQQKQEQVAEVEQIVEEVQKQKEEVPQVVEKQSDGYKYTIFTVILRSDGHKVEMKLDVKANEIEVLKVANALQEMVDTMKRQATGEREL